MSDESPTPETDSEECRQREKYEIALECGWPSFSLISDYTISRRLERERDDARRERDALIADKQWKPISTLFHDENTIVDLYGQSHEPGILYPPERHPDCCYMKFNGEMKWVNAQNHPVVNITHWMPIPSDPDSTE